MSFINLCQNILHWFIPRHPQTLSRPSQTQSRHPKTQAFLCNTGHWKKSNIWVSWPNMFFAKRFSIDAFPDTLIHNPNIIQTPSDTLRHHSHTPRHVFMQYMVQEESSISDYGIFHIRPMDLVFLHPETSSVLRHIPDTNQTPQDRARTPPVLWNIGHWK